MIQAWDKLWAVFPDVADFQIDQRSWRSTGLSSSVPDQAVE